MFCKFFEWFSYKKNYYFPEKLLNFHLKRQNKEKFQQFQHQMVDNLFYLLIQENGFLFIKLDLVKLKF